ncbi:MAG: RIP metalloprotease RseP, partial [Nevskiales bacterium]|nr:RIP metalloprotease RseP [Nevskiales bacterium]
FSIGFGRPLWRRQGRDGVEYIVAALPLGGYVKMLDEREGPVPATEAPRAFNRQNVRTRMAIVAAGPVFNFLLAIAAYWAVYVIGVTGLRPVIAEPAAPSRAAAAGLRAGEEILRVNGKAMPTWEVLRAELMGLALDSETLTLEIRQPDGEVRLRTLELSGLRVDPEFLFEDLGLFPFQPDIPPILSEVLPGEAAAAAGLQAGDRLLAYNNVPLTSWQQWTAWLRAHPGAAVTLEVQRGAERLRVTVVVGREVLQDGRVRGRFGAGVNVPAELWEGLTTEYRLNGLAALPAAVAQTVQMSGLTLKMLYRMVLGDVSVRNISGPIQIAQVAGYSASAGLAAFLSFIAIVSVSLAVLNLLPVPVLDGGHLLYCIVEAVKGAPLSERVQALGQRIGLALLVTLMGLAFYNDILRLIY